MTSKFKWKLSMESIHTINEEFERLKLECINIPNISIKLNNLDTQGEGLLQKGNQSAIA